MQGLPILLLLFFVVFFCRFQLFCISLLLISNRVLWGLFSSSLSLCDDFRKKKMGFLLPCISGHIKALTRRQLRGQSPLFVSMVFRLVVVFVINLFFFF